jgi:hypothetical protein
VLVRLLTEYRGAGLARPADPGQVWDLPDWEASLLVEQGKAVPVTVAEMDGEQVEQR